MNEEALKKKLSKEQFNILRRGETERPFSGKYVHHKEDGAYHCAACGNALFDAKTKFDSGSGWPSFDDVMGDDSVTLHEDTTHGMRRTEVRCAQCDSHLGHVFPDGPTKTGTRYCINSGALDFQKDA